MVDMHSTHEHQLLLENIRHHFRVELQCNCIVQNRSHVEICTTQISARHVLLWQFFWKTALESIPILSENVSWNTLNWCRVSCGIPIESQKTLFRNWWIIQNWQRYRWVVTYDIHCWVSLIATSSSIKQIIHNTLRSAMFWQSILQFSRETLPHFQLSHKLIVSLGASTNTLIRLLYRCTCWDSEESDLHDLLQLLDDIYSEPTPTPRRSFLSSVHTDASTLGTKASRSASATNFLVLEPNDTQNSTKLDQCSCNKVPAAAWSCILWCISNSSEERRIVLTHTSPNAFDSIVANGTRKALSVLALFGHSTYPRWTSSNSKTSHLTIKNTPFEQIQFFASCFIKSDLVWISKWSLFPSRYRCGKHFAL